jgi:hypothetical protein
MNLHFADGLLIGAFIGAFIATTIFLITGWQTWLKPMKQNDLKKLAQKDEQQAARIGQKG